jgi:hypothetical protein
MNSKDVVSVGDRMWISVELIENIRDADIVIVRVKEIRRDADGLVTLVLECDPNDS